MALYEIAEILAKTESELAMVKVALKYAIADIPHTCDFCMSNRCDFVYDCHGCENGSNWQWYGWEGRL